METKLIVIPDGKICDYIDGKFRNDTPEEYVRQTIEKRLVNEHKYLRNRICVEYTIQIGSRKKRADIVIFTDEKVEKKQENIKIIIECKSEKIEANNSEDGVSQLKSYMAACANAEWGMWTNSKEKFVFKKFIDVNGSISFIDYNDIPSSDGNIEDIDRPKRSSLKNATDDNLLFTFKTCHNHIYANEGMQKQPAFFELLKVIFCKIEDERNIPKALEFYATSEERSNPDGQLTVKNRIEKIFDRVKKEKKNTKIFETNDTIKLNPRTISHIVSELQKYSLLNTRIDIKGKAYEEIVGANLRGDRGEFFTPRNVMNMVVQMINPTIDERILDSSCGTGGFLVTAMNYCIKQLQTEFEKETGKIKTEWNDYEKKVFQDKISDMAMNNYFGFDINPDLVKATKMNMVMNNDGSGNILQNNSLLQPHEWTDDFKTRLASALQIDKKNLVNKDSIGYFNVIITNPPFGSKIQIKDHTILSQFDLARIWKQDKNTGFWKMTDKLQSSVPPEILFIERCWQFLKPGGRMGIVLPDALLGSPGTAYIREWLIKYTKIIASIDLHEDTFQPRNGTQTSVLILQKKNKDEIIQEEISGKMMDYNIFMAIVDKIGHDKRGNTLFQRDKEGNEILISEKQNIVKTNEISSEEKITQVEIKEKIVDDQTLLVPNIFNEWKKAEGILW